MKQKLAQTETAARPRWMIVDDNEEILLLMQDIAAQFSDAEIECFNSPHAALAAFGAAPEHFVLVITDFEMPGMNGVELRRRFHAISPTTKILLATGSGLVSEEAAANEGFCGLLHKPFPFAALQVVLENIGLGNFPENSPAHEVALATA
jgi:two-component system C4-dicarboxylate transport response regulator DctD